jgi:hypothetical protein
MPDVLAYDTPIRPIKPRDDVPAPADRLPAPEPAQATFVAVLHQMFVGLLGR